MPKKGGASFVQSRKHGFYLIGEKLGHSHSPAIHALLGNSGYSLCEVPREELAAFFAARKFAGVNVTIPYKTEVMGMCDFLDGAAVEIGAVNTVVNMDGKLFGCNTDFDGFIFMCNLKKIVFSGKKVLILGSGGTSKTVAAAARKMGASAVVKVSRSGEINYENVYTRAADAQIIVNTTPVGMYPKNDECPLELERFKSLTGVVDVIYNPLRTRLLLDAERLHIPCAGGLSMLVAQAAFADRYFCGRAHSGAQIVRIIAEMQKRLTNIVLIGMPGCGKSTIGKILAPATRRRLIDIDRVITERAGVPIPTIFETQGEPAFRDLETAVTKEVAANCGVIIACGGGTVLREENRRALRQNGCIIYVKRKTEELAREGRPLSAGDGALEALYESRREIYEGFADITVPESPSVGAAAAAVLDAFRRKDLTK